MHFSKLLVHFFHQVEVIKNVEHFDTSDDVSPTALQTRTDAFDAAFKNVEKKAAKRETNLLNAIKFFNFKSQCDRCKFWLSERQRDLLSIKSTNENRWLEQITISSSPLQNLFLSCLSHNAALGLSVIQGDL